MTSSTTMRCENLACLCEVEATQAACSDFCASPDARDPQNVRCGCGHPKCADAIDDQLHGGAGRES